VAALGGKAARRQLASAASYQKISGMLASALGASAAAAAAYRGGSAALAK